MSLATSYCSSGAEHQNIDWVGIHEKICQLLIPLRTPIPFTSGSEEERRHRKEQQRLRQVSRVKRLDGMFLKGHRSASSARNQFIEMRMEFIALRETVE